MLYCIITLYFWLLSLCINISFLVKIYLEVITLKKQKFTELLKSKGFYGLLFVGVLAIVIISFVNLNLDSQEDDGERNYVDLNEPLDVGEQEDEDINTADNNQASDQGGNQANSSNSEDTNTNEVVINKPLTDEDLLEFDIYPNDMEEAAESANTTEDTTETSSSEEQAATASSDSDESVPVMKPQTADSLNFSLESMISWPVKGNVIMNYATESLVQYVTLGEWKVNPAVIISCDIGSEVKAAAKGVISEIYEDEETGTTVVTNVGDDFKIVYGQLENLNYQVGDMVEEGSVLGTIAEQTMYYEIEGSNLYFQVLENDAPVNPLLLLNGEE